MAAGPAHAQVVQRSFVNQSFERPYIGTGSDPGCSRTIWGSWVPGWSTTENASNPAGFNSGCPTNGTWTGTYPQGSTPIYPLGPAGPNTANMIQLFRQTFASLTTAGWNYAVAAEGTQWAELNADSNARLYQSVCLVTGERVNWTLSHRGRTNVVNPEVMAFNIGPNANGTGAALIVRGADTVSGSEGTPLLSSHSRQCGPGVTCNAPSTNSATGWTTYSGYFNWSGASAMQTIGFEAIYGAGGSSNGGNYLDNIHVTLKPFLQFAGGLSTTSFVEGSTAPTIRIHVVGEVPTGGITIPLTVTGTASAGSDYTLTSNISVPAGDYGEGTLVDVPLTFLDDTVIENNETLILTIPDSVPSSPYVLAHTEDCGAEPNNRVTINLYDNDIDLLTDKSPSTDTPLYGTPFTYTVTFTNRTAPTTSPATSHDVTTAISDPVPAGLTFSSWTCAASGTAGTACPGGITSGSGAISGNAVLPAGGTVTYTVTATLAGRTCDAISNTSTISVPAGFTEGTSVQSGYNSPPPTSSPSDNNTASASVTPRCTNLRISKTNTATTNHLDAPSDTLQSGQSTTYTLLVENGTPAVTGAVIRDVPGTGITCPAAGTVVTCTGSGSACTSPTYPMSDLTGAGITLGTLPANGSVTLTFTCTVD